MKTKPTATEAEEHGLGIFLCSIKRRQASEYITECKSVGIPSQLVITSNSATTSQEASVDGSELASSSLDSPVHRPVATLGLMLHG